MSRPRAAVALLALGCVLACGRAAPDRGDAPAPRPPADDPAPPPAPWSAALLTDAPAVYLEEWSRAENRESCAPLAFRGTGGLERPVEPRRASFAGGWAVAYDAPGLRSAYGIAGTGVEPGPDTYDEWPHRIEWADGSSAGYGPEGGSGPRQLAYLRVAGQRCLYNVWSAVSVDHLERLLAELRFVAGAAR